MFAVCTWQLLLFLLWHGRLLEGLLKNAGCSCKAVSRSQWQLSVYAFVSCMHDVVVLRNATVVPPPVVAWATPGVSLERARLQLQAVEFWPVRKCTPGQWL